MATATMPVQKQRKSAMRPKYVLFAFIALMMAYVLRHNESFLVHPQDPVWQHYHPFRWWLLPHGIAGACALLLGPLQFSDRLRRDSQNSIVWLDESTSPARLCLPPWAHISNISRSAWELHDRSVLPEPSTRSC